ncbi:MAG: GNAT family N-acetyltransferase [Thiomicrorhabdus sp.]|nr:GNAT family N-acetyltransferase [Thiomicrorhabdus sp.]
MDILHRSILFVETLQQLGVNQAIANVQTKLDLLVVEGEPIPTTLNDSEFDNSYVCSPYTAYISYAQDELQLIQSKSQRRIFWGAIRIADKLLKLAKINQTISINNWLVSTNLPPKWSKETIPELTDTLIHRYPVHSFNIRSLNWHTNAELMHALQDNGWLLIPARQVYLFDNQNRQWWHRSHTKRDQSLLRNTKLTLVQPAEHQADDFEEIRNCFNKLFIEKHSHFNPQFSTAYLYEMHKADLIQFYSFRDPNTHKIIASIGLFTQQDIITTPMVGYDTEQPKELGLYRLLMAVLLKETYESGQMMNLSSGAGSFKRARGGLPTIEYTAFYTKHLSCKRIWIMQIFAKLLNKFAPKVLENNQI